MTSIRGRIFSNILRKSMNMNASHTSDSAAKLKRQSEIFNKDRLPDWLSCTKETTPAGTRYERIAAASENTPAAASPTGSSANSSADPTSKKGRLLLYFHGGAYISGLLASYRNLAPGFYEAASGCEVIYLDYHLAPKHCYPTQLNEALDLWEDLTTRQGYDPKQIIVGGDSAGGNLTLALLLKLRDLGKTMPRAAFCISAWADMTGSGQSFYYNYGKDVMFGDKGRTLTEERKERLLHGKMYCYIGEADRTDPYISPVFGDYHGFPPMFFTAGTHEMLLDDTLRIAEKLKACGVPVTCELQPGMFHIYVVFARFVPEGKISYQRLLTFIRDNFDRP